MLAGLHQADTSATPSKAEFEDGTILSLYFTIVLIISSSYREAIMADGAGEA